MATITSGSVNEPPFIVSVAVAIDKGADADAGVDLRGRSGGGRRGAGFEAGRSGGQETA